MANIYDDLNHEGKWNNHRPIVTPAVTDGLAVTDAVTSAVTGGNTTVTDGLAVTDAVTSAVTGGNTSKDAVTAVTCRCGIIFQPKTQHQLWCSAVCRKKFNMRDSRQQSQARPPANPPGVNRLERFKQRLAADRERKIGFR